MASHVWMTGRPGKIDPSSLGVARNRSAATFLQIVPIIRSFVSIRSSLSIRESFPRQDSQRRAWRSAQTLRADTCRSQGEKRVRASEDRFREDTLALHRVHRPARVAGGRRRERLRRPYLQVTRTLTYRPRARKTPRGKAEGAGASRKGCWHCVAFVALSKDLC